MRIQSIAAAGLLSLAGCGLSAAESALTDTVFERDEPASALMILSQEDEAWRVAFRAGGVPNGEATAADCELQAVGPKDAEDAIAARVVPFEGELNAISAADVGANALVVEVRVGPEGVIVTDGGAAARFCGLGSDIDGFYRRIEFPE